MDESETKESLFPNCVFFSLPIKLGIVGSEDDDDESHSADEGVDMEEANGGRAEAAEDVDDEGDKVRLSMELVSGCVLPTELCRIMGGDDALSPSGDPGGDMPKIPHQSNPLHHAKEPIYIYLDVVSYVHR